MCTELSVMPLSISRNHVTSNSRFLFDCINLARQLRYWGLRTYQASQPGSEGRPRTRRRRASRAEIDDDHDRASKWRSGEGRAECKESADTDSAKAPRFLPRLGSEPLAWTQPHCDTGISRRPRRGTRSRRSRCTRTSSTYTHQIAAGSQTGGRGGRGKRAALPACVCACVRACLAAALSKYADRLLPPTGRLGDAMPTSSSPAAAAAAEPCLAIHFTPWPSRALCPFAPWTYALRPACFDCLSSSSSNTYHAILDHITAADSSRLIAHPLRPPPPLSPPDPTPHCCGLAGSAKV